MSNQPYQYQGAQALVTLHESHLREFLKVWRQANEAQTQLPKTDDPNYASLNALLNHVLLCAASYLYWICEKLELKLPEFADPPPLEAIGSGAEAYLEEILAAWRGPLQSLTVEQAESPAFPSAWGPPYIVDAMLEHAVMHPIRHSYQLKNLMGEQS